MQILCPSCGFFHEVIRTLDDGFGDNQRIIYELAPMENCSRQWMTQKDLAEAATRFGEDEPIRDENEGEELTSKS